MGERTDEIRDYSSPDSERYAPLVQSGSLNEYAENFTPDYSLTENAADDSPEADTEAIRDDIEQTRTELARTVDAIQARLNPETMKEK